MRERERERQRQRQTDRDRQTDRQTETERDIERELKNKNKKTHFILKITHLRNSVVVTKSADSETDNIMTCFIKGR